jgi:hypothetical protein
MGRGLVVLGTLVLLALALPVTASAGTIAKRDSGGVPKKVAKRFGLTKKERRALDIASVRVTGREGFGVFVKARFKGNVERLLGRGHLRRAAIALVLRPKSKAARPSVLVTLGPAKAQRVLRRTRSRTVGVIRRGRTVTFFIRGAGFSGVASAQVKAIPRAPRPGRGAAAAQGVPGLEKLDNQEAEEYIEVNVADLLRLRLAVESLDTDDFECDELEDLLDDLEADLRELSALRDLLGTARRRLQRQIPRTRKMLERAGLRDALEAVEETLGLVNSLGDAMDELADDVEQILAEECAPPNISPLRVVMAWSLFGENEVFTSDAYFRLRQPGPAQTGSQGPVTAIRIVIPDNGSTNREITNFLCPTQLPNAALESTSGANDTLACSGGSLALEERFGVNIRTSPNPSAGMGGQIFGYHDGAFRGPFPISGP